jgi:hypothetical protein
VVSFTTRPLYSHGKSPRYPLDRRLGGSQSRTGRGGEEKNSQRLPGLKPPIIQLTAQRYTTELSRLIIYKIFLLRFFEVQMFFLIKVGNACNITVRPLHGKMYPGRSNSRYVIILKWNLDQYVVKMGDEFKWLFIGCSNNFLMTVMKFRFA